jgi:hypothetical protein
MFKRLYKLGQVFSSFVTRLSHTRRLEGFDGQHFVISSTSIIEIIY